VSAPVTLERLTPRDWPAVAPVWKGLSERAAEATFFISTDWVGTWLEEFAPRLEVEILLFHGAGEPVGACLLVRRTVRKGPFPVRTVYLNAAGEDPADTTWVEFNDLLCLAGWEDAVAGALMSHLGRRGWDELRLERFCRGRALEALRRECARLLSTPQPCGSFYVDLARLRAAGKPYESVLGSADRARLRQNCKRYGRVAVHIPDTVPGMLEALEDLAALHQKAWAARGRRGAFASAKFHAFHRRLIARSGPGGGIQMSRVEAGGQPIGVLYNLIHRGRAYFYQSGLAYTDNKRLRPGFLALVKTIDHCLRNTDLEQFHFMPGDDHYKRPLATGRQELESLIVQRPTLKNRAVKGLRGVSRRLRASRTG
jgi:CelD/BcsL family acetyltransferase involved in cellulose biosynthesis